MSLRWTFVVPEDIPEHDLRRDDIVTAAPGRPTRVLRAMPINNGLLLNLALQDKLVLIDGVIGPAALLLEAIRESDDSSTEAAPVELKVIR